MVFMAHDDEFPITRMTTLMMTVLTAATYGRLHEVEKPPQYTDARWAAAQRWAANRVLELVAEFEGLEE